MSGRLRVEGLYDHRTFKTVRDLGRIDTLFDFRPLSMNFIQQYQVLDILKNHGQTQSEIFLKYENEADFMVTDMIEKVGEVYGGKVILEFSDNLKRSSYEKFNKDFYWHYTDNINDIEVLKSDLLKGIVLDFSLIEAKYQAGNLQNFVQNFYRLAHHAIFKNNAKVVLKLDWSSNTFSSLFELFDFDLISISVSPDVEICYRNVDQDKLKKSLKGLERLI